MSTKNAPSNVKQLPVPEQRMALDEAALEAARHSLDAGAVTPSYGPWRADIIKLLNDSLATELVCVLRYKRHHFTADGLASPKIAEEFLVHANEESAHADLLAERIVQLGGIAEGTARTVAERSELDEYPVTIASGTDHVRAMSSALAAFGSRMRLTTREVDELEDAGSADICTEISRGIDKWLWFVESHGQAKS